MAVGIRVVMVCLLSSVTLKEIIAEGPCGGWNTCYYCVLTKNSLKKMTTLLFQVSPLKGIISDSIFMIYLLFHSYTLK